MFGGRKVWFVRGIYLSFQRILLNWPEDVAANGIGKKNVFAIIATFTNVGAKG